MTPRREPADEVSDGPNVEVLVRQHRDCKDRHNEDGQEGGHNRIDEQVCVGAQMVRAGFTSRQLITVRTTKLLRLFAILRLRPLSTTRFSSPVPTSTVMSNVMSASP